jgi:RNA polymerase sigma-70 factor (ECF subfamily)
VQSAENAQDLTQETFLKAWKGVPHLWGGVHVRAWLFQIAINETKLYWRRQKLKAALSLEMLFAPRTGARAEEALPVCLSAPGFEEAVGEQECVRATLSRMPPHYRECLLLYDHFGFKQAEIARLLQVEESTVSANLYRARARFRQLYRQVTEGREQGGSLDEDRV